MSILNTLDTVYKAVIGVLWNATVSFGLSPKFAFLIPFTSYGSFRNLGLFLSGPFYFQIAALVLLISSSLTLAYNSFVEPMSYGRYIARIATSLIVGSISFFLVIWALKGLDAVYQIIYSSSNLNWNNFLLFSSSVYTAKVHPYVNGSYSALIELFALTGYFTAVVSLFAELMLRQALMLMAILLLPVGTVLYSVDRGRRFAVILWEIIVEMSIFPFLILVCLYLANVFSWDMPLQLAFLFLPSLIPGLFFATGNSFLSAPVMGFLGGMSLSRTVGKGVEAGSIVSGLVDGTDPAAAVKRGALFPVTEKNPLSRNLNHEDKTANMMPWKDLMEEELRYRKEY